VTSRARVPLTRRRVLEAALALVDRDGLDALSMRRLGAELGVEAMSIYHHIPGKEAILDGLVELVTGDLGRGEVGARSSSAGLSSVGREEQLRHGVRALRRIGLDHPEVFPLVVSRAEPRALAPVEATPAALRALGIDDVTARAGSRALVAYAIGFTLGRARHASTVDDDRAFEQGLDVIFAGMRSLAC